ncbi:MULTISPECIES: glucose 1-dehydrogenase [Rhodococcus]|jgi:3alpha(or 20beta)-hydroxysteroid dehydrogenase|uniref:glucose 1-dehydrogenase n=1 Tax=Rhodococcus TaxID=1827 RepID=UPI000EA83A25|nr:MULTISPECIES: glucose 1-dehydrogenase [Rhodococcus]NHU48305.1 glucose 1-dehydrogenase [Rhodococcus sp. A14]MDI9941089.1 glucose 1-dehydrogenase [Rhodococcus sp. IEGM 1351]MDJ0418506.1 glucose 1-dehydrogenase [Rhodococcus opacus]QZS56854.1 glucose 1-dehydrogenase [Rhodococcus opacus]RKM76520.1 3-alpha-hydroxysteroid dehydrogenase [Rhodococcus opacus]
MGRVEGRTAIVTGGARGMGAAHARKLAGEGARVVVADVLTEEGKALAHELGDAAVFAELDVRDPEQWSATIETARTHGGEVSILVNNAGITRRTPLADTTVEDWNLVLDINLTGAFLGIQAVAPSMRAAGGGAIINVSSMGGLMAIHPSWAYTASKWALRGLTKVAALDLGSDGIRVNSIHPGFISTPMLAGADEASLSAGLPLPRVGSPEEVADLMLFLAAEATYSTASEFSIDGGILAGIRAEG